MNRVEIVCFERNNWKKGYVYKLILLMLLADRFFTSWVYFLSPLQMNCGFMA